MADPRSRAVARQLHAVGEGLLQLVNGENSVLIGGTRVRDSSGGLNFAGIAVYWRDGALVQPRIPGFVDVEESAPDGRTVLASAPVVLTITNPDADKVRIILRWQRLMRISGADTLATSVQYAMDVRPAGGGVWTEQLNTTVTDKSTGAFEKAHVLTLPVGGAPWEVRIRRITADSVIVETSDEFAVSAIVQITETKLMYPGTALLGLIADTKNFQGQLTNIACEVRGRTIRVPSNYDPVTRHYDGVWDGTFKMSGGVDNPAWILYDTWVDDRGGVGDLMPVEYLDKWTMYRIGRHCDEYVPDGYGGWEPRYTFNGCIDRQEDAYKLFQMIANSFRGAAWYGSGLVTASQDAPEDFKVVVNQTNVIGGRFKYFDSGVKANHSIFQVHWRNPEQNWRLQTETYEDPDALEIYGHRLLEIDATRWCTSRGAARRIARQAAFTERHEGAGVEYIASFDHFGDNDNAGARPGVIVQLHDPIFVGTRMGGRVRTTSTTEITVDKPVALQSGKSYRLTVVLPDGTPQTRDVVTSPGSSITTLEVDPAFDEAPAASEAIWNLSVSDLQPRTFRIMACERTDAPHELGIVAMIHYPEKYATIETDDLFDPPQYSQIGVTEVQAPTILRIDEDLYLDETGDARAQALFSWRASETAAVQYYQPFYRPSGTTEWITLPTQETLSVVIRPLEPGSYDFQVKAITSGGRVSPAATLLGQQVLGLNADPGVVQNFRYAAFGDNGFFQWDALPDLDLKHYTMKYNPSIDGTATRSNSTMIAESIPKEATSVVLPLLVGTYLIYGVDRGNNESPADALIVTAEAKITAMNAVEDVVDDPTFPGDKVNTIVYASHLRLAGETGVLGWSDVLGVPDFFLGETNQVAANGSYECQEVVDLGEVYTSRVTADVVATGLNFRDNVLVWPDFLAVSTVLGDNPSQYRVTSQIARTNDDPGGVSPTWGPWETLVIGDYSFRGAKFRLLLESLDPQNITPQVARCRFKVDMPDRIESERSLVCPPTGLTVSFDPPFKAIPAVAAVARDLQTGDYWEITAHSRSSYTILFKNSGGTGVTRTFDSLAKGYGREIAA